MDLNDYFDPVSIQKPLIRNVRPGDELGKKLIIHTPDRPVPDLLGMDIALVGVPEDRNSQNKGASSAPDHIRQKFYSLSRIRKKIRMIDLGNMRPGKTPTDTYFGIRDVVCHLMENQVVPVIMGGTQDITYGCHEALMKLKKRSELVTVDARLDLDKGTKEFSSENWLEKIIRRKTPGIHYTNLGHQEYMTGPNDLKKLGKHAHQSYRLGRVRSDMKYFEPFFRDAFIHSFDISAVRQSDAPGTFNTSPNGFSGMEMCQMARFSGLSDHISVFLITEVNPLLDNRDQTSHLAAQIIWYFADAFAQRIVETPDPADEKFTQYIVSLSDSDFKLTFLKSSQTDRWWIKTPDEENTRWKACSYQDYQMAGAQEIPERWLDFFK